MSLALPLSISSSRLARNDNPRQSVSDFLTLLLSTPAGSCKSDPDFGFVFNNLRFEAINENEGVVYNADRSQGGLYEKKLSGSSKNLNTFASELKDAISRYESRLKDVSVTMTYIREEKKLYVTVRGRLSPSGEIFEYYSNIKIWN